ncbi:MAG: GNAT family N-acetyltransferase [Myxococcales bacterium]|nr:GNAT family N-acetyltransferase [Myxococcota bacterium]MDW8280280.1 GNAT family N-acetyltransferase [Myxococcales bacterium]
MTSVRICPADLADLPEVKRLLYELDALHARLHPAHFRCGPGPSRTEQELRRAVVGPDQTVLLARVGAPGRTPRAGEVYGLIHLRLQDAPLSPSVRPVRRACVEALYVARPYRRQGWGRQLMEQGARWAAQRGACQLVLTVWHGNEAAQAFYERLGCRPVNTALTLDIAQSV